MRALPWTPRFSSMVVTSRARLQPRSRVRLMESHMSAAYKTERNIKLLMYTVLYIYMCNLDLRSSGL